MTNLDQFLIQTVPVGTGLPPPAVAWPAFAQLWVNGRPLYGYLDLLALVAADMRTGHFELATCSCGVSGCADVFDDLYQEHETDVVVWIPGETTAKSLGLEVREYRFERGQFLGEIARFRTYLIDNCQDPVLGPAIEQATFSTNDADDGVCLTKEQLVTYLAYRASSIV